MPVLNEKRKKTVNEGRAARSLAMEKMIMAYVISYTERAGYPPAIREICALLGLSSVSTGYYHLSLMQEEGLITRAPGIPRSVRVTEKGRKVITGGERP